MSETQTSISHWANSTFGPPKDLKTIVDRFLDETTELAILAEQSTLDLEALKDECADCLIVLYQVADTCGFFLSIAADEKMKINRNRKWDVKGDGTAQHID